MERIVKTKIMINIYCISSIWCFVFLFILKNTGLYVWHFCLFTIIFLLIPLFLQFCDLLFILSFILFMLITSCFLCLGALLAKSISQFDTGLSNLFELFEFLVDFFLDFMSLSQKHLPFLDIIDSLITVSNEISFN